jgi:hypothetical protein
MVIVKAHSLESRYRRGKRQLSVSLLVMQNILMRMKIKIFTCVAVAFEAASSGSSGISTVCLSA